MNEPLTDRKAPRRWVSLVYAACLILLAIPAIQPLLSADLTCGYDNAFHLWRAVQMGQSLREGDLLPQWAPEMAGGYGLPLFIFAPPLTPYLVALLNWLGLSWSVAFNCVTLLGMLAGAAGMVLLARELFGAEAGLLAGVAYLYAPFQAYDVFNRGSLSEAFAWAFPPLILWGLHRWMHARQRRFLVLSAVSLALMVLTHYLFGFLFAPLLIAWVLLESLLVRDWRLAGRGALVAVFGLGLSAYFWLPALAERTWVQTDRLLGTWVFDYHFNFLDLQELFSLPRVLDPSLLNDWPPKALGLLPAMAALLPWLGWARLGRAARWRVVTLTVCALLFALLTLSVSLPLWERLPLLPYIQFPWRYLGPAAFCLALLAGASLAGCGKHARRLVAVLALLMILANLSWFYPTHCAPPSNATIGGMVAWEQATDTIGATAKGEYLPIWAHRMPSEPLFGAEGPEQDPVARLRPSDLPPGARILQASYGATHARIELEIPASFRLEYRALYYPGWQAKVDDALVRVSPTEPEGLVSFDVPAGRHQVEVRFTDTPLRRMAKYASLASLAALIAMWAVRRPTHPPERAPQPGLIAWLQRLLRRVTPLGWALAVITLTFSAALALNVSPFLRGPTDWRWVYAAPSQPQRLWLPAAALVAYLAVACGWVRSANGAARPRWQRIALFAALLISVPALQLALIAAEHTDPLRPLFYRTVSAGASGVFSVGSIIEDMSAFLRQYPTLMPTFPVHPQRYPPGLALLFYAARRVFEAFPALADGVGSHLRQYQCHDLVLMRLPNATIASTVIQMALPLVSGLTLLPLYGLARHLYDRRTATWVAALYPLVPSFALWSARWEQFYPLLTCVAWYFFYVGLTQSRTWALFASGLALSISSMLNFSLVSLLLPLGLFTLVWLATHRDHLRSAWRGLVTGGLVFLLGLASLWILYQLAFGTGFVDIWRVSMGYHLGLERGYWTWLVYHLYDFLVFLGLPLAVLWLMGVIKALRGLRRSSVDAYTVSVALGLFLLDLSGTSRGEVARVWLFLTPLVALAAAHMLVRSRLGQSTRGFLWVASLLAIQLFTFNTYLRVVTTGLVDPPARTSTYAPPSEYEPVSAQFGDSIALLGYDISPTEAAAGETLHLTLYWQALEPIDHTYTVATHVVGSDGTLAGQQDNMPVHDTAPTTCWLPGEVIADPYDIAIDAAAPPGSYTLETGLYIWESGERLPAVGADADRYNMVSLAELEIGSP